MTADHELIHIGDEFYSQSGSAIGSMYEVCSDGFHRVSPMDIGRFCERGETAFVRPATEAERGYFALQLMDLKRRLRQD